MICPCLVGTVLTLYPVRIEPADAGAQQVLDRMRVIYALDAHPERESLLQNLSALTNWFSSLAGSARMEIGDLAAAAWRCGQYWLGYRIGEMEDMVDAKF